MRSVSSLPPGFVVAALTSALLLMAACAPRVTVPGEDTVEPPTPEAVTLLPAATPVNLIDDADPASLREAVERSLTWLRGAPPETEFDYGIRTVTAAEKVAALSELSAFLRSDPAADALQAWTLERFELVESGGPAPGRVLVTGYYEPVIAGAREPTTRAPIPVHARPADLVTARLRDFSQALPEEQIAGRVEGGRLAPYFTRKQIQEEGALDGRGLELAWVEDRVDLFFLEVQGSGAIRFPDGSEMRIGYAAANGHPYRSIGRLLIGEGQVPREQMSMQTIRAYLEANPHEVSRVLNSNPSYVFFRELDTPPQGALGVPVTAGRSIATDLRLFPRAALAFLETRRPELDDEDNVIDGEPLRRFVLNHDTGGAIRGPHRVDFFWGRGADAERLAGLMQQEGRLLFLVPRRGD